MILALIGSALAVDCAALLEMERAGVEPATIATTIAPCSMDAATVACVQDGGGSPEVVLAARKAIDACAASPENAMGPTLEDRTAQAQADLDRAKRARFGASASGLLPPEYWDTPDPGIAVGLSTAVGFGAGHFYSNKHGAGAAFAVLELASIIMIVVGTDNLDAGLITAGGLTFGLSRAADIGSAGFSAQATRRAMLGG